MLDQYLELFNCIYNGMLFVKLRLVDKDTDLVLQILRYKVEDANDQRELEWLCDELTFVVAEVVKKRIELENQKAVNFKKKGKLFLVD